MTSSPKPFRTRSGNSSLGGLHQRLFVPINTAHGLNKGLDSIPFNHSFCMYPLLPAETPKDTGAFPSAGPEQSGHGDLSIKGT